MEFEKVIKRINERMANYERHGLTDSANYQKMRERIQLYNLPTTTSKSGELRISRKKADLSSINLNDLMSIDKMPSLAQEVTRTRQKLKKEQGIKPSRKEIEEHIANYGKLQKWAEEKLDDVYIDAKAGVFGAKEVEDAFDNGVRKLSYADIWNMIDKYEKAKAKTQETYSGSMFAQGVFNNDEDVFN